MVLDLYQYIGDERVIDKTLTNNVRMTDVNILEECSLIDPVFTTNKTSVFPNHNYAWFQPWGRYYFIKDVRVSNGRTYIYCHVDVLKTYANMIKNSQAIATRSQTKFNAYLNDEKYKTLQYQTQYIHKFNTPFSKASKFILVTQGG